MLFHFQYIDGVRNGEEELHLAVSHHRSRLASLGSFTTVEADDDFNLVEGSSVEVLLSPAALSNGEVPADSGLELNSWVAGRVVRVDGMQVEVEYGDGQYSTWFHFVQKEVRKSKVSCRYFPIHHALICCSESKF